MNKYPKFYTLRDEYGSKFYTSELVILFNKKEYQVIHSGIKYPKEKLGPNGILYHYKEISEEEAALL